MNPIDPREPKFPKPKYGRYALLILVIIGLSSLLLRKGSTIFRTEPQETPVIVSTGTVLDNDVFSLILARYGVENSFLGDIQTVFSKAYNPRYIQAGHRFEITTTTSNVFLKLVYQTNPLHSFVITRSSQNAYALETVEAKTKWVEKRVQTSITSFLEKDLADLGLESNFVSCLAWHLSERIFAWRIDFYTEQRKGDTIDILLEQEYIDGHADPLPGTDHIRILYANYTGSGTRNKENIAVRYQAPGKSKAEYFDASGKAVERPFLRAPFTKGAFRVSSGFNMKRFHPILRTYRAHHGTDYAASKGTPVAAIGKGTVVRAEWYKGYGNCIDIRHSNVYTSRYGHLSRLGVKRGQSVGQGQYVGNVGSTGLSTGPHLHFEMLVNGKQQNFTRMNFPPASSVAKENMPEFEEIQKGFLARLNAHQPEIPAQVAMKAKE